jgi:hypothetical protein
VAMTQTPPFGIQCEDPNRERWVPIKVLPGREGFYREEMVLVDPTEVGWTATATGWVCPDHAA